MKLIYNDVEIELNVLKCRVKDNMGGKADSLTISFSDIKNECRKWNFKKGDKIEVVNKEFSSGAMYVDSFEMDKGIFTVKALSLKKKWKSKKTRCWENVKFSDVANDIAKEEGLKLKTYGVKDFKYSRVEQIMKNNIDFLNYRCCLEGYNLKVSDNFLIIVSEEFLINQICMKIYKTDFLDDYKFKCTSNNVYGGCNLIFFDDKTIKGSYIEDNDDEILSIVDIPVTSLSEANRFCKNITKSFNKYEIVGKFIIDKINLAAGNLLEIELDNFSGVYIVESVLKNMINGKSNVMVRRIRVE